MNIPNLISISRILAVPLAVWLITDGHMLWAFWVFIAAGVSDALDGFIAKQFNMETELGKYLDPIADKALLVSVYVSLGISGHLPSWVVILVVFRDFTIVGGALLLETVTHSLTMHPIMVSKVNTVLQIVLAAVVLADAGYNIQLNGWLDILIGLTIITTVLSGFAYLVVLLRDWAKAEAKVEAKVEAGVGEDK
ncbi:CDP-alcohol phosphatidyltransferase family protein [Pseudomonadota bacterium]